MSERYEIVLTCPKGLEGLLLEEAKALGLEEVREQTAAVRGHAEIEVAYRLCLLSRLANRVLLVLRRFPVSNAEELYQGVLAVDWAEHLDPAGTLAVEFSGHGAGIDNTHFGALKVKDAIVDKLRTAEGIRPSIDKVDPHLRVHLRLDHGEAVLSHYVRAVVAARCGRADEAFRHVLASIEAVEPPVIVLAVDPSFRTLHADPRWAGALAALRTPRGV